MDIIKISTGIGFASISILAILYAADQLGKISDIKQICFYVIIMTIIIKELAWSFTTLAEGFKK